MNIYIENYLLKNKKNYGKIINMIKQKQIEVLKEAKQYYISKQCKGMCDSITSILQKIENKYMPYENIVRYIPTFNFEHILELTKGTELEPKLFIYWWNKEDRTIRPKIFDILINELENQTSKIIEREDGFYLNFYI